MFLTIINKFVNISLSTKANVLRHRWNHANCEHDLSLCPICPLLNLIIPPFDHFIHSIPFFLINPGDWIPRDQHFRFLFALLSSSGTSHSLFWIIFFKKISAIFFMNILMDIWIGYVEILHIFAWCSYYWVRWDSWLIMIMQNSLLFY